MIYIDQYPEWIAGPQSMWHLGGHLLTTDIQELHAFAGRLKLRLDWFQDELFPHYDLTKRKRETAINHGAKEIKPGHLPADMLIKRQGIWVPIGIGKNVTDSEMIRELEKDRVR